MWGLWHCLGGYVNIIGREAGEQWRHAEPGIVIIAEGGEKKIYLKSFGTHPRLHGEAIGGRLGGVKITT
jgi:hypothetical protein